MSRYAGPTTDILLKRVREHGGIATSFDFAMQILSYCQRTANAGLGRVISSGSLTTYKQQLVYSYRDTFTDAIDIVAVKDSTRTLSKVDRLSDLTLLDPDWFRATGTRHEHWCQVGRDLLVVYPAKTADSSLTVVYSKLTSEFKSYASHYNTSFDLSDEDVDLVLGLAEVVLLVRSRQFGEGQERIEELSKDIATHFERES